MVALKILQSSQKARYIEHEVRILENILKLDVSVGFPKLLAHTHLNNGYLMCTNLLGPSLSTLYKFCKNVFSLNTIITIGLRVLDLLERLHKTGHVHNDIKPDNFVVSLDDSDTLNIIDFGFTTPYLDKTTGQHIENGSSGEFKGTRFYAALSNLKCK